MPVPALALLLLVNLVTIFGFRGDKRRAAAGAWRVPEAGLLGLAAIGGTPGALLASRLFRHKTRKQPFATHALSSSTRCGRAWSPVPSNGCGPAPALISAS
ncbi:MAG TPA: DUF1294 domain-containing protein [Allosphingosinicella sp.]|nr:DUF1294 domain-containing protein [Allosphingosinicella sp.]